MGDGRQTSALDPLTYLRRLYKNDKCFQPEEQTEKKERKKKKEQAHKLEKWHTGVNFTFVPLLSQMFLFLFRQPPH